VADPANAESVVQSTVHYIFDAVMPVIQVSHSHQQRSFSTQTILSVHCAEVDCTDPGVDSGFAKEGSSGSLRDGSPRWGSEEKPQ